MTEPKEFNYIGNVSVGADITIDELKKSHHAVVITMGAETDRKLGIPGEDLKVVILQRSLLHGITAIRNIVIEFDLSNDTAVIIGQGNVAADVARILSKTVDELKHTDISQHALDVLAESKVKNIYIVGRRGPVKVQ